MPEIRIESWSVIDMNGNDFLRLPECAIPCLHGAVYDDPRRPDGTVVTTSPIVSRIGDIVTTKNGTVYKLGQMDPEYAKAVTPALE